MKKIFLATLITSIVSVSQANSLEGLSLGLGVGYQQKPFVGDNSDWVPVPHVEYQSGMFFIKGLKLGLDVLEFDNTKVDIHLKYQSLSFKPSDSHGEFTRLDRRKSTVLLGTGINHRFNNDLFVSAEINGDILGRSKGLSADANVGYYHYVNDHFTLIPLAGLKWDNNKHNRYYYGVSANESAKTGIQQYRPGASFTPHIALGMVVKATDRFHILGGVDIQFLPSEVKNSPITNRSTLTSVALGINYNF